MVGSKITHRPHTIMIRKLSELLVPGSTHRPPSPDYSTPTTSPRSPLDYPKIHSPRGLKNFDFDIGGVGLGIVAALHKTITPAGSPEVFAKHSVCCLPKSDPIAAWRKGGGADEQTEICENYTYVTSRGGAGKPCTKVFYDGGESGRLGFPKQETVKRSPKQETAAPTSGGNPEFLSCCDLCRKELHGLDVYMYRGDKGFCSTECRSTQMSIDEQELLQQKLKCRSEARRSAKRNTTTTSSSSSSPPMFSTGILAI